MVWKKVECFSPVPRTNYTTLYYIILVGVTHVASSFYLYSRRQKAYTTLKRSILFFVTVPTCNTSKFERIFRKICTFDLCFHAFFYELPKKKKKKRKYTTTDTYVG